MVDFAKLANMSLEEMAQSREKMEREWEERGARLKAERTSMVEDLVKNSAALNDYGRRFVRDMQGLSTNKDAILGEVGGGLLTLSEKQVKFLHQLHQAVAARAVQGLEPVQGRSR